MAQEDAVINKRVTSLKRVYFFFAILSIILFAIILSFGLSGGVDINRAVEVLVSSVLFFSIYYGLKYKRKWTPPLILIVSAYNVIGLLFMHHYPVAGALGNLELIIESSGEFMLALFYAYQLFFFSRKNVRTLFGATGKILYS